MLMCLVNVNLWSSIFTLKVGFSRILSQWFRPGETRNTGAIPWLYILLCRFRFTIFSFTKANGTPPANNNSNQTNSFLVNLFFVHEIIRQNVC